MAHPPTDVVYQLHIQLAYIEPFNEYMIVPRCLDGARAYPPEDCGGVGGYARLLEALRDGRHPEHKELRAWVGKHYDPELFSFPMHRIECLHHNAVS